MVLHDLLIVLEHLDRMPAKVRQVGYFSGRYLLFLWIPVFDRPVMMNDHPCGPSLIMMYHCMHQNNHSFTAMPELATGINCFISGDEPRIDLHSALFDDIHHVDCQGITECFF